MRAANIKTIKKNEQELKTIKNLEQIPSGKNIKNAKNGIISKDNVKLFKKNKRFNKMQTEDIIEELEVKRSPNYISIEKNVEANKLEKSKSSSFLPQSYIQVKFINIKEKIYEFAKYHETKTLKRINSQIQAIKDYQKLMEINDEPIYQAKTFKTRPKIKDQRSIKKSFRRLDSPFQEFKYEKKCIIKSRSITHTKTSPTKLCNTNTLLTVTSAEAALLLRLASSSLPLTFPLTSLTPEELAFKRIANFVVSSFAKSPIVHLLVDSS